MASQFEAVAGSLPDDSPGKTMAQNRASRRPNKAGFSTKDEARAYLDRVLTRAIAEEVVASARRGVELARRAETVWQHLRLAKIFVKKLEAISLPSGYPNNADIQLLAKKLPENLTAVLLSPPSLLSYFRKFSQTTQSYLDAYDAEAARSLEVQLGTYALAAASRLGSEEPVTPTCLAAIAAILDIDGAGTHEQRLARWKARMPAIREQAARLGRLPSMAPVAPFDVESRR